MSLIANSESEKPKSSLGLQNPVLSLPSVITKEHIPAVDDDDLLEFDFGTVCDTSQTPRIRRAENFRLPEFSFDTILNLPPRKKAYEHDQTPVLPILEPKQTTQKSTTFSPIITTMVAPQKNIFDDDDDMPEWCPPNVELSKPTVLNQQR
ncbi:hypothetical protein POUND7_009040 [Theobroma cacao]